jgi:hypothetical protein
MISHHRIAVALIVGSANGSILCGLYCLIISSNHLLSCIVAMMPAIDTHENNKIAHTNI